MEHFKEEIQVEAPIDHVWAFYCDTAHWKDWMPRLGHLEVDGPLDKVGTTYSASMRLLGFEMKSTYRIVEVEPLRLIREHGDMGPMDNSMRFEPIGEATRVILESDYTVPGHLPGFIKNVVTTSWLERNTRQMLADFKALAEVTVPAHA